MMRRLNRMARGATQLGFVDILTVAILLGNSAVCRDLAIFSLQSAVRRADSSPRRRERLAPWLTRRAAAPASH